MVRGATPRACASYSELGNARFSRIVEQISLSSSSILSAFEYLFVGVLIALRTNRTFPSRARQEKGGQMLSGSRRREARAGVVAAGF
jgi:hypothetical protein